MWVRRARLAVVSAVSITAAVTAGLTGAQPPAATVPPTSPSTTAEWRAPAADTAARPAAARHSATATAAATATATAAAAAATGTVHAAGDLGYDVSHPQCGSAMPTDGRFAIVGVDGVKPYFPNPCLAEQIVWARSKGRPAYYVNTANPGPRLSDFWPRGQQRPRVCARNRPDSEGCAYDYGWNAAKDSLSRARTAARAVGARDVMRSAWWLDVEAMNTWESIAYGQRRKYFRNDTAVLTGMRAYLRRQGIRRVGVCSTADQWQVITGGARLGSAPVWYAGLGSLATAPLRCSPTYSFTGGPVRLAQFATIAPDGRGIDGNVRC